MKKFKNLFFVVALAFVAFAFPFANISNANLYALNNYNSNDFTEKTLLNQNFNNNPDLASIEKNPSGWTKLVETSTATSGIIYVDNTKGKFTSYHDSYHLEAEQNPYDASTNPDAKILMINSKNDNGVNQTKQGYKSNDINLSAYSATYLLYHSINCL